VTGHHRGPKQKLLSWWQSAITTSACYVPSVMFLPIGCHWL